MSNILIIKHGSLGDIAQASGAIQDICESHKNDNIYIPQGDLHRLENIGKDLLKIVEIQIGKKISEDDIERLEDDFGRV